MTETVLTTIIYLSVFSTSLLINWGRQFYSNSMGERIITFPMAYSECYIITNADDQIDGQAWFSSKLFCYSLSQLYMRPGSNIFAIHYACIGY